VLKTCNRVEIYMVATDPESARKELENLINGLIPFDAQENLVQYLTGLESVGHLIRVSCGLPNYLAAFKIQHHGGRVHADAAGSSGFCAPPGAAAEGCEYAFLGQSLLAVEMRPFAH
jgi:hypothetical protein